ncbi:MAG TPA: ImcF-related family protein [Bryobacteraceae bacterium]|nr:ImcF-related family protein [Bryobacteraceae bacterium]
MKIQWAAGLGFVAFMALAVVSGKLLKLQGPDLALFLSLLGALGLGAAAFFVYFQTKYRERREAAAAPAAGNSTAPAGGGDELDTLLRDASARLVASKAAGGANLSGLPVVLVVGDRGSAKTSTVLQSGIEPELLAGNVYQNNAVAPTRTINAWFARGLAFLEAGGPLLADPATWLRLIRRLQPGKLRSVVVKGRQAPRAVLVCFDGESFLRQGANEAIPAAARYLQARFGEISQTLGISFPVYVLFTKMDRVPFFSDYVRNLSNEEAMQVFGITVPVRAQRAGVYAEEETQRLTTFFNNLFYSLCDKRLEYLPRETDPEKLPGAYEFPREFRKLRNSIVQLLVDLCRPSQLRASPFLRGFYFSGVRPVVVSDVATAPAAPRPVAQTADPFGGATGIFRAGKQQEMIAQQAVAQQHSGGRKVPQWMFTGHLFNGILLKDQVAMQASGSSVKTSFLKRLLFSVGAGLCLLYSIALLVSFLGNRALENQAIIAARNISAAEAQGTTLPSQDSLQRLESLRQSLERLTGYETDGAPLHLRWGLYSGSAIYPSVRRIYYNKFNQLLFASTEGGLLSFMQRVPPAPGPSDDYGLAYNTLKAYLLTTSQYKRTSDRSLQQFLSSLLLDRWSAGHDVDIGPDRKNLAKLQFDFYSRDLVNGNPFSSEEDAPSVERARKYLAQFSGVENVYQGLLAEAAKVKPSVSFNQAFPGTADVVTSMQPVHFVFTKDGWDFVQKAMKRPGAGGEQWVLGTYKAANVDHAALSQGVLDHYTRDYINQWRAVLKTSKVNAYANLKDASAKLNKLTSTQTPLLGLFWWISQNTGIGLQPVADAFKPIYQVVPPSPTQQYIVANNQTYVNALLKLQQTIDQAATMPNGPDPNAEKATRDDASSAKLVTKQLSNTFPIDRDGHVESVAENLLLQPITNAEALTRGMGAGDLNAKGAGFCSAFNGMTRKFPFNAAARDEATLQELNDLLKPKDGKLWVFYDGALKNSLTCQGSQCQPNPSSPVALNPAFVRFFNQVVAFSRSLYGDSGTDPNFKYSLRPQRSDLVESFDLRVNDQAAKLTGGQQQAYIWPGPGTRDFRLTVKVSGGSSLDVQTYDGLWAVFRFFADADRSGSSGSGYTFSWVVRSGRANSTTMINGKPLAYQFDLDTGGAPAIFSKDFLAGLKCVSAVAR